VAEAIEAVHADRLDEHLIELARHYAEAATAGDADRAVGYAVRAGNAATARLAHEEAAGSFRLAAELAAERPSPDAGESARLGVLLGEAQRRAGDPGFRQTLLAAGRSAVEAGEADAAVAAALANRPLLVGPLSGPDTERLVQLQSAVDVVSGRDGPELARLLAQLGCELTATADHSRSGALTERALAMAERVGDPVALADVMVLRNEAMAGAGDPDERLRLAGDALDLLAPLAEPALTARALVVAIDAGFRADEWLDRAQRLADELGDPTAGWRVGIERAKRLGLAGRPAEAGDVAAEAAKLGEAAGHADAPLVLAGQRLALAAHRQAPDRLLPEIVAAAGEHAGDPAVLVVRAWALARSDRADEARTTLDRTLGGGLAWLAEVSPGDRPALAAMLAEIAEMVGDAAAAEMVVPELEAATEPVVVDWAAVRGSIAHFTGLANLAAGRLDAAEERLVEAIDVHRRLGAPVLLATSQAALARALAERGWPGDRPRLDRLVDEAAATAGELGLDALAAELSSPPSGGSARS
jgi:hypothetical protein